MNSWGYLRDGDGDGDGDGGGGDGGTTVTIEQNNGNQDSSAVTTTPPNTATQIDWTHTYTNEVNTSMHLYDQIFTDTSGNQTVGMGFNLSTLTTDQLTQMGASTELATELSQYIGQNATTGTIIPDADLNALGQLEEDSHYEGLDDSWKSATGEFLGQSNIPQGTQQALNDLNYWLTGGVTSATNLWSEATSGDWQAVITNLQGTDWKDNSQPAVTRRDGDAQLIINDLASGALKEGQH